MGEAISRENLRFGKSSVTIFAFGFYRNHCEEPWFRYRDVCAAIPDGPYKNLVTPSKGHFTKWLSKHAELGLVERKELPPHERTLDERNHNAPWLYAHVTESGEEYLIEGLLHAATHQGLSVPELVHISQAAESILNASNLLARIVGQVRGQSAISTQSPII
jgi:hypothetical protein